MTIVLGLALLLMGYLIGQVFRLPASPNQDIRDALERAKDKTRSDMRDT